MFTTASFHAVRISLRATLTSALLVFGHVLLTSALINPLEAPDASLVDAVQATSALISLSLLWVAFTLLEAADLNLMVSRRVGAEGEYAIFGRTVVEFGLNSALLAAWAAWSRETILVVWTYTPAASSELGLIVIAYGLCIASLALLQFQLVTSIALHAARNGPSSLFAWAFWGKQTGHWTEGGVVLDRDEEEVAGVWVTREQISISEPMLRAQAAMDEKAHRFLAA